MTGGGEERAGGRAGAAAKGALPLGVGVGSRVRQSLPPAGVPGGIAGQAQPPSLKSASRDTEEEAVRSPLSCAEDLGGGWGASWPKARQLIKSSRGKKLLRSRDHFQTTEIQGVHSKESCFLVACMHAMPICRTREDMHVHVGIVVAILSRTTVAQVFLPPPPPRASPLTCGGPQREGLDHVAHRLDPTIRHHRYPKPAGILCHFVDCGALRPAARHH